MNKYDIIQIGVCVTLILLAVTYGVMQPHFEAKSFNRLTGGSATYWDAVFTNLRVDGSSQRKENK